MPNIELMGRVADWRLTRTNRGWRLEDWQAKRQELSGGEISSLVISLLPPRILDRSGHLERTCHALPFNDLLAAIISRKNLAYDDASHSLVSTSLSESDKELPPVGPCP